MLPELVLPGLGSTVLVLQGGALRGTRGAAVAEPPTSARVAADQAHGPAVDALGALLEA